MRKLSKKIVVSRLANKIQKVLKSHEVVIIVVTGSVGKTSTKVAIGKLLSTEHQVRFSEDSYNTDIGLPLSFFGLKVPTPLWDPSAWHRVFQKINTISKNYPYEIVVLEMADDELEDMLKFLKFIKPKYSVVTAVAPVHLEWTMSIDKIIHDNWKIASGASNIIYNADQPELAALGSKSKKATGFGLKNGAVRFGNISRNSKGYLVAELRLPDGKFEITTKMIGLHSLGSLLAAASVASKIGMPGSKIAKGLSRIEGVNGRMKLLAGANGSRIIDDSYNASPKAVCSALDTLAEIPAGRRIAVLGSMVELGDASDAEHYKVGKHAAKKADMLITIGKNAEIHMVTGAKDAGMSPDDIKIFKTPYEAGHFLKRIIDKKDLVLVKGSQNGIFTEEATRILLAPDINPSDVLVRQSKEWKRKKRKAFGL